MKYPKVLTLGSFRTEHALDGEVIIQEKIDGSQFRWGTEDGKTLTICSKNRDIQPEQAGMFEAGVQHLLSRWNNPIRSNLSLSPLFPMWFFGEYLQKPKHNTLKYKETPKNHIVLFDAFIQNDYVDRGILLEIVEDWDIDIIPEFHVGEITKDDLLEFHNQESYLGGEKVEGIVIKNYNQIIEINGQVRPLFTKFVREEFRERHMKNPDHKPLRATIEEWMRGFKTEARWEKAVQALKEEGRLLGEPKDIGGLIKQVIKDIDEEESDNIKEHLYKHYIRHIHAIATSRLAEWYKDKLLENVIEIPPSKS